MACSPFMGVVQSDELESGDAMKPWRKYGDTRIVAAFVLALLGLMVSLGVLVYVLIQ